MKKILAEWLSWLGVIVGCLSLVSAITRIFEIGLSGIFAEMVTFYRNLAKPLFDLLTLFHIELTRLQTDLLLVYLVLLMMSVRAGLLPLLNPEILKNERARIATYYEEIATVENENFPPNMIAGTRLPDGRYSLRLIRYKPDWQLFLRGFAATITLTPILTLLPFRRAFPKSYGRMPNWRVLMLAFSLSSDDERHLMKEVQDGSFYNTSYLKALRSYAIVGLQAATLPFATILFFVLARYSPVN